MDWWTALAFLCWGPAWYLGYRMRELNPIGRTLAMEVPEDQDAQFLVVAKMSRAARAREMWERGQVREGESLELWINGVCRGAKGE